MKIRSLEIREFPEVIPLKKLLGPSFIILGLGLGSGEIILWPYLSSNFGMGIIWAAVLGITFQFFMNMEIERYALSRGESVFAGFARKLKILPFWFVISTFIPWIWPGIIASSANFLGHVLGIQNTKMLSIALLILIGLILTLGPVLYKTVETLQKTLISVGVPIIFLLTIYVAKVSDWEALVKGVVGIGDEYLFLPKDIVLASFLGALAYAGAGGNLNLAQSSYVREKGYGMGKYTGRITSLLTGSKEEHLLTGSKFEINHTNLVRFDKWWKAVNIEHFAVFWFTGVCTILLLALLSFSTTHGLDPKPSGINFVIAEANQISNTLFPVAGILFLIITGVMLFATQLTVLDATSRIISENIMLSQYGKFSEKNVPLFYYATLWVQILCGILIYSFGISEPLQLVTISAVLNAIAMFIHVGLTLWLNLTSLEKEIRPGIFRITMAALALAFYGGFSIYTLADKIMLK